jgi:hypothetical protein
LNPKIVYVFADSPNELNTSRWRMWFPSQAMNKAGYETYLVPIHLFIDNPPEIHEVVQKSQIIVIERNLMGGCLMRLLDWELMGKVIILNFDDGYHAIEKTNASYNFWHEGLLPFQENGQVVSRVAFPHPYDQFVLGCKISHAATLPNKELCKYYSRYTPTYYLPNYFRIHDYIDYPKLKRDYVTLGWGGSLSHLQSFRDSGILLALKNVFKVRLNVKLIIAGDKRVFDLIDLPEDRKIFQQYLPYIPWNDETNTQEMMGPTYMPGQYRHWGQYLSEEFDIGLAPLCGLYDTYRSIIKPVEFCLTKTPWLGSAGPAYKEVGKHGRLVENTSHAWEKAILNLLDNLKQENERMAGAPYEFGLSQDIDKNTGNIMHLYKKIAKEHAKIDFDEMPDPQPEPPPQPPQAVIPLLPVEDQGTDTKIELIEI